MFKVDRCRTPQRVTACHRSTSIPVSLDLRWTERGLRRLTGDAAFATSPRPLSAPHQTQPVELSDHRAPAERATSPVPPEFADQVLLFGRGSGREVESGFYFSDKLDAIVGHAVRVLLR